MSGLRIWTGKEFHERGRVAAKVLSPNYVQIMHRSISQNAVQKTYIRHLLHTDMKTMCIAKAHTVTHSSLKPSIHSNLKILLLLLLLLLRKFIERLVSSGNCQLLKCQLSTYNS